LWKSRSPQVPIPRKQKRCFANWKQNQLASLLRSQRPRQKRGTKRTRERRGRRRAPSLLHPEPLIVAAPRPQPAPGDVLHPHAEDEVAPPPLPAGAVARGQRVVQHVRHAGPDAGITCCLSNVVLDVGRGGGRDKRMPHRSIVRPETGAAEQLRRGTVDAA